MMSSDNGPAVLQHAQQPDRGDPHRSSADDITESVLRQFTTAPFACGGAVAIEIQQQSSAELQGKESGAVESILGKVQSLEIEKQKHAEGPEVAGESKQAGTTLREPTSPPVDIRFGADKKGSVLRFPLRLREDVALKPLIEQCKPAKFARGQEEILDESYRKASKLDPSEFATSFCPYRTGIIDVIAQMLLPSVTTGFRGVKAELYSLALYTAPSGKFKAHVDTPRSEQQFGSLVVCLPAEHKGTFHLLITSPNTDVRRRRARYSS